VTRADDARGARLRVWSDPEPAALPPDPEGLLRALGGPTLFHRPGRDRARRRMATTLLHGNEPSGLRAMHAWLRSGARPAVDAWLLVASVEAALGPPAFSQRTAPGHRDLNRCFLGPFTGPEGVLAREILDRVEALAPEALIDLHNNTGHNPPYGVAPHTGVAELQLTALFGERIVQNRLRLGALVEVVSGALPAVVVEVGRAGEPEADRVALRGLARFLDEPRVIDAGRAPPPLQRLHDPVQVRARPGVRLAFGHGPSEGADLTVEADVDRHNFEVLEPGVAIGWVREGAPWPLEARSAEGRDLSRELFDLEGGRLAVRRGLVPIMMTTDAAVAQSDCLFYAVRPDDRARPGH
jgi:hypothetical protein